MGARTNTSKKSPRRRIRRGSLLELRLLAEVGGHCAVPGCMFRAQHIHHIDGDPSNSVFKNCIYLCGAHHEEETRAERYTPQFFRDLKGKHADKDRRWNAGYVRPFTDFIDTSLRDVCGKVFEQQSEALRKVLNESLDRTTDMLDANDYAGGLAELRRIKRLVLTTPEQWKSVGPRLLTQMGVCLFHLGRFKQARQHYEQALSIRPWWKARANLANVLMILDEPEEALETARLAHKSKRNHAAVKAIYALALRGAGAGATDRVERLLREAHDLEGKNRGVVVNLANVLVHRGEHAEAAVFLRRAADLGGHDASGHLLLGVTHQLLAYAAAAESGAYAWDGRELVIDKVLGKPRPAADCDDLRRAVEHLGEAIRLADQDPAFDRRNLGVAHCNLGGCLSLQGKDEEAYEEFERASAYRETRDEARMRMCQSLSHAQEHDRLLAFTASLPRRMQRTTNVRRWQAEAHLAEDELDAALPELRVVCGASDSIGGDYCNLAAVLAALDQMGDEFEGAVQEAVGRCRTEKLWRNIALFLIRRGECGKARSYLEKARQEEPDGIWVMEQLGRVVLVLGDAAEFERVLEGTEAALLGAGGSLAWAAYHLRRGDLDASRRHLDLLREQGIRREDAPHAAAVNGAVARGEKYTRIAFGCRVVVA